MARENITGVTRTDMGMSNLGAWAFIIGVLIALVAGLAGSIAPGLVAWGVPILVILGIIVGFLNISDRETEGFVFMTVAIVVVASLSGTFLATVPLIGGAMQAIFSNIIAFVTPAAIIVSLKAILSMARE
jgi:hypothetical protein